MTNDWTVRKRFWLLMAAPFVLIGLIGAAVITTDALTRAKAEHAQVTSQGPYARFFANTNLEPHVSIVINDEGATLANKDVADYTNCQMMMQDEGGYVSSPFELKAGESKTASWSQLVSGDSGKSYVLRTKPGSFFMFAACSVGGKDEATEAMYHFETPRPTP